VAERAGLTPSFQGTGVVVGQVPAVGKPVAEGRVQLVLADDAPPREAP
jgi:hypothetical protein